MTHPVPCEPAQERLGVLYGITVGKLLAMLDHAEVALVRVPTGTGLADYIYLALEPDNLRALLAAHTPDSTVPCQYDMNTRRLVVGSPAALKNAEAQR